MVGVHVSQLAVNVHHDLLLALLFLLPKKVEIKTGSFEDISVSVQGVFIDPALKI